MPCPKRIRLFFATLVLALVAGAAPASATDFVWTNTAASGYFTNMATTWNQTVAIPGIGDDVLFTNNLTYTVFGSNSAPLYSANVYFTNTAAGAMSVTEAIGNTSWTVTNQYVVGASTLADATTTVTHASGTLAVTNNGLAKIVVGQNGRSVFTISGGTVLTDLLIVTNNAIGGATNSLFLLNGGTLTTSNAMDKLAANVVIATNTGPSSYRLNGTWNMFGGTNIISFLGTAGTLTWAGSSTNTVGPGAVLVVTNVNNFTLGHHQNPAPSSGQNALLIGGVGTTAVVNVVAPMNVGTQSSGFNLVSITNGSLFAKSLTLDSSTGASGNKVIVSKDGILNLNAGALNVGNSVNGNTAIAIIDGGVATNIGSVSLGSNQGSLTISNGGRFFSGAVVMGGNAIAANDQNYNVGGLGAASTVSNGALSIGVSTSAGQNVGNRNTMTVTNATLLSGTTAIGSVLIGGTANGASNNSVYVLADGSWNLQGNSISVGVGNTSRPSSNNLLYVDGGIVTNITTLVAGSGSNSVGNSVIITNGGQVFASTVRVGSTASTVNNSLFVAGGGLLEANTLSNFIGGVGNTISNVAGIFQFTTNTPTVKNNGFGTIALTGGTVSFRAITNADVYANQGAGPLAGIAFNGANTFRLNAGSNSLVNQTYTFDNLSGSGNSTNFAHLEMINGATAYRGGDLTIGPAGTMLISNTTASITGLFTNQGVLTLASATANFANGVINSGTLRGSGTISGNVTSSGTNSPGFSVGKLTIAGDLTLTNGAVTWMELAANGSNDLIAVTGQLAFGGNLTVTNITGFAFAADQSFQLFSFGSHAGSFDTTNLPVLVDSSLGWDASRLSSEGILSIVVVPEPATILLTCLGALGLIGCRRACKKVHGED